MKITQSPPPMAPPLKQEEIDPNVMHVARQYEALFVNHLVGAMRKTVVPNGLIPQSQGEKVYQGMLDYEYSQKIADTGELGLARMIYDHLLQKR